MSWTAPDDGGSPLTGYTLSLRQNDLVYSTVSTYCDMTTSTLTTCTIPVYVFRSTPFDLPWGSSIYAKVIATNLYGDSTESTEGNGAVISTTPDAPINLTEEYILRTKSTLGLLWEDAAFTGGIPIIDYRIWISSDGGATFEVSASNVQLRAYTVVGLTAGITYQFKI